MDDIMIQFARLWGQHEALCLTPEDEAVSNELKAYDSEEMLNIIRKWAAEYEKSEADDTVEFFEGKIEDLSKEGGVQLCL